MTFSFCNDKRIDNYSQFIVIELKLFVQNIFCVFPLRYISLKFNKIVRKWPILSSHSNLYILEFIAVANEIINKIHMPLTT